MSEAMSRSQPYLAILVPSEVGTVSALTPEREARIELALSIAFVAVVFISWVLRPEMAPDRRATNENQDRIRPRRVTRR